GREPHTKRSREGNALPLGKAAAPCRGSKQMPRPARQQRERKRDAKLTRQLRERVEVGAPQSDEKQSDADEQGRCRDDVVSAAGHAADARRATTSAAARS